MASKGIGADADGWYVQLSKRSWVDWGEKQGYVEGVVMIDEIDLNKNTQTNGDRRTISLGANYSPEPHLIFKLEYDFVEELSGPSIPNDIFWASMVVEF